MRFRAYICAIGLSNVFFPGGERRTGREGDRATAEGIHGSSGDCSCSGTRLGERGRDDRRGHWELGWWRSTAGSRCYSCSRRYAGVPSQRWLGCPGGMINLFNLDSFNLHRSYFSGLSVTHFIYMFIYIIIYIIYFLSRMHKTVMKISFNYILILMYNY